MRKTFQKNNKKNIFKNKKIIYIIKLKFNLYINYISKKGEINNEKTKENFYSDDYYIYDIDFSIF